MPVTINGQDIVFEGQVKIVNGFNPDTGVAYMILTPDGGVGQLPFLAQGLPGLPPEFDSITVEEVAPGDPLPTPNPVVTPVNVGGPGVASRYTMKFYVHSGATGAPGTNTIALATDLATTPSLGLGTDKFVLVYRASDGKWVPMAQKVGDLYVPGSIGATAFNATSARLLAQVNIPPQPFDWRPKPFAQVLVTGSTDTRVDLIARLNNPASGDQVGFAKGVAGAAPPPLTMIPAPPAGSGVPGAYGKVPAGEAATVYLRAEQKAASSNSWSTPAAPDTTFCVEVHPVP